MKVSGKSNAWAKRRLSKVRESVLTVPEASYRLGLSERRVQELAQRGDIASIRVGKGFLLDLVQIEEISL